MTTKNISITVLGAGNMGTALANIIANNGFVVKIWNYEGDAEPLAQIKQTGENKKYLPGIKLSKNIVVEADLTAAVSKTDIIFFAIPSGFVSEVTKKISPHLSKKTVCVNAAKGLDKNKLSTVSKIISTNLPTNLKNNIVVISGPAVATDMVENYFTAMNIAGAKPAIALTKKVLENENLRLIKNDDLVGTEVSGSLKNVYAIAIGLCDCYGYPMNTKAAIFVSALKEISVLVKKMGGNEKTVYDLAGLGDLIGTAMSEHSRNRRFGACLPKYLNKEQATKAIGQTVEGIETCKTALALAKKYRVIMPLAQVIYEIVWNGAKPDVILKKFLKNIN